MRTDEVREILEADDAAAEGRLRPTHVFPVREDIDAGEPVCIGIHFHLDRIRTENHIVFRRIPKWRRGDLVQQIIDLLANGDVVDGLGCSGRVAPQDPE